ncbi:DUF3223 domain-containing protein [Streptomyces sp. NPDC052051]|uniref:DUF3223 domain-containing protein n=1 Tax=Streptomyces sp. NPDC052051 TaxID=3154649 RepID=UPI003439C06E
MAEELKVPEVWIGSRRYATKKARQEAVQAILGRYGLGQVVDQEDDDLLLRDLLDMHPDAAEKVGPGVDRFRVIATPRGHHKGPEAILVDGSKVAFSYQKCLDAPTHRQRVLAAMRTEIQPQVNTYGDARRCGPRTGARGALSCARCNALSHPVERTEWTPPSPGALRGGLHTRGMGPR